MNIFTFDLSKNCVKADNFLNTTFFRLSGVPSSLFIEPILPKEVAKDIYFLQNSEATGISSVLIKNISPKILHILTHFIN